MNIAVGIYALLLLAGGMVGYFKAGSMASLVMGAITAILFAFLSFQNNRIFNYITIGLTLAMTAFFGYRFMLTLNFMPAGLMVLISLVLLLKLWRDSLPNVCLKSEEDRCYRSSDHKKL